MSLSDHLWPLESCPLCGATHAVDAPPARPNLYSEKLAQRLQVSETALLTSIHNLQCSNCGLVYKSHWFNSECLQDLFSHDVPVHPRGWDIVDNRYSVTELQSNLDLWEASNGPDSASLASLNKSKRVLRSLLDSMTDLQPELRNALEHALASYANGADAGAHFWRQQRAELERQFSKPPAMFKRFTGFASKPLWDWCWSRIKALPQKPRYGELGCPLWGQFAASNSPTAEAERVYLRRSEPNFWGKQCMRDGQHCLSALQVRTHVQVLEWDGPSANLDLLSVIQYLDHLPKPADFIRSALRHSRNLLVILETPEDCAIQHISAWSKSTMHFLCDMFELDLHCDFDPLQSSDSCAYLLTPTSS